MEYLEDIYPKMSNLCKEDEFVKTECANITKDLQDGKQEYQLLFQKIKEMLKKEDGFSLVELIIVIVIIIIAILVVKHFFF